MHVEIYRESRARPDCRCETLSAAVLLVINEANVSKQHVRGSRGGGIATFPLHPSLRSSSILGVPFEVIYCAWLHHHVDSQKTLLHSFLRNAPFLRWITFISTVQLGLAVHAPSSSKCSRTNVTPPDCFGIDARL